MGDHISDLSSDSSWSKCKGCIPQAASLLIAAHQLLHRPPWPESAAQRPPPTPKRPPNPPTAAHCSPSPNPQTHAAPHSLLPPTNLVPLTLTWCLNPSTHTAAHCSPLLLALVSPWVSALAWWPCFHSCYGLQQPATAEGLLCNSSATPGNNTTCCALCPALQHATTSRSAATQLARISAARGATLSTRTRLRRLIQHCNTTNLQQLQNAECHDCLVPASDGGVACPGALCVFAMCRLSSSGIVHLLSLVSRL